MNFNIENLTPIEKINNYYFKRDDKFIIDNICGGKVRSAYQLIQQGLHKGYNTFVTAGSRHSPQVEIVSYLCEILDVKCIVFIPRGEETTVIKNISQNKNTTIERTKVGYNNVICSYAENCAKENNYCYIPFGMECLENIEITSKQVSNIPKEVKRIVMPVGSGMSFISVINGLNNEQRFDIEVLGVQVGKSPDKNIKKYMTKENKINYTIVQSDYAYDKHYKDNVFQGGHLV